MVNPAPATLAANLTVAGAGGATHQVPLLLFEMGLPHVRPTGDNDTNAVTLLPYGTVVYRIDSKVVTPLQPPVECQSSPPQGMLLHLSEEGLVVAAIVSDAAACCARCRSSSTCGTWSYTDHWGHEPCHLSPSEPLSIQHGVPNSTGGYRHTCRAVPANMIYNPSYELAVNIGVPDGKYVDHDRTAAVDVGATFFADSRLAVEGLHSLRLSNPSNDSAGLLLAPYTLGNSAQHPEAGTEFLPLTYYSTTTTY